jgi:thioredoxin 2
MAAADPVQIVCPHDGVINRVPSARLADRPRCGKCQAPLFSGAPLELDAAGFQRHVASNQVPLLVDFWAPWCGPCRMMAPAFEKAAGLLEPGLRLAKVDTEAHPEPAGRFNIRSIPTLILFSGGREIARQSGAMTNPEQIALWARSHLTRGPGA